MLTPLSSECRTFLPFVHQLSLNIIFPRDFIIDRQFWLTIDFRIFFIQISLKRKPKKEARKIKSIQFFQIVRFRGTKGNIFVQFGSRIRTSIIILRVWVCVFKLDNLPVPLCVTYGFLWCPILLCSLGCVS